MYKPLVAMNTPIVGYTLQVDTSGELIYVPFPTSSTGLTNETNIAQSGTLTSALMSGGQLNNIGQTDNMIINLLPASKGMNFMFLAGNTIAKYIYFNPDDTDQFFLNGATWLGNGKYLGWATVAEGYMMSFQAFYSATYNKYEWFVSTINGNTVNET